MKRRGWLRPFLPRFRPKADVTICIPAWQSELFIDRTIRFAQGQTHRAIRIAISVDRSDDSTLEICRRFGDSDERIEVFSQRERLGWAGNTNFLIDRVNTEFFFLYFHDDIILPQYTETLLSALRRRPDAASAFAAMGRFGGGDSPSHGRAYEGSVGTRLVSFLTEPDRGSPLRALTRRAAAGTSLRLPSDAIGGFWANEPYLLRLLSAGPVLHCPDNLYLRWDKRSGGLTDGWKRLTPQEVCAATRSLAAAQLQALADAKLDAREHAQLAYVLQLNLMSKVWGIEKEYRIVPFSRPDAVHSALDPAWTPPPELAELEPRIQERIAKRRASMVARGLPIPGLEKR